MAGPGTGFDYNDAPQLTLGDSGVWVAFLKEVLRETFADTILSEEDTFDEATAEAVRVVQDILDLPADGVVDRTTWAAIASYIYLGDVNAYPTDLQLGAQGGAIRFLQRCLAAQGSYSGEVTGTFDRATQNAVREFHDDVGADHGANVGWASWLYLGMWAVLNQIPVEHDVGSAGSDATAGADADADADGESDAQPLVPLDLRGVFLTSVVEGVAQMEVLVHNPNSRPVQHLRVEVLQEHEYNDETVPEVAGNDAVTVTIAADTYTADDGRQAAFGQVRVAWLDPMTGDWSEAVEQEFNVALEADGSVAATGTGESTGPHVTISRFDQDDTVTWDDDDSGRVDVRITLVNDGQSPAHDASIEVEQPVSGGGSTSMQIIQQTVLDVGAEHVEEIALTVPRRHHEVPFHLTVRWAATSGHGTEHSVNHQFFLNWTDDGRVTGISVY